MGRKSHEPGKPNDLLRQEREKRGLSQARLAELIGAASSMISRWERGARGTEPFYQEKLCELFGKDAVELGLTSSVKQEGHEVSYADRKVVMRMQDSEEATLAPARFLTMEPEALIERYSSEKDKLVELNIGTIAWTIPEVVIFDNSKLHLPVTAIEVQQDTSSPEYVIPTKIAGKAEDILEKIGHHFYDSTTIRLTGIESNDHGITLTVSKARFMQYVATNYAMDAMLKEKGWTRSLRDIVHPTTHLCRLEESLLCNHIGVGALVFTSDNYLVIPFRSNANIATWRQTISPSISGATCYDDDMWNFRTGPVASWMREGREELGLENKDFVEGSDTFFGLTRDLLRGGKPEMFFAVRVNLTRTQLEQRFSKAKDKQENKELRWFEFTDPLTPPTGKRGQAVFLQEFLDLVDACQDELSRPAQVNFALWFKYLSSYNLSNSYLSS